MNKTEFIKKFGYLDNSTNTDKKYRDFKKILPIERKRLGFNDRILSMQERENLFITSPTIHEFFQDNDKRSKHHYSS